MEMDLLHLPIPSRESYIPTPIFYPSRLSVEYISDQSERVEIRIPTPCQAENRAGLAEAGFHYGMVLNSF